MLEHLTDFTIGAVIIVLSLVGIAQATKPSTAQPNGPRFVMQDGTELIRGLHAMIVKDTKHQSCTLVVVTYQGVSTQPTQC